MASNTLQLVKDALELSSIIHTVDTLDNWRKLELGRLHRYRKACEGGMDAVRELNRKGDGEAYTEYEMRLLNARNLPICHIAAETFADLMANNRPDVRVWVGEEPASLLDLYYRAEAGEAVDEDGDPATQEIQAAFDAVLNAFWPCHQKMVYNRFRDGHSIAKVYPYKSDPRDVRADVLGWRFAVMPREDVRLILHPDDPAQLIAAIEYRALRGVWRLWDATTWQDIDGDFKPTGLSGDHDFEAPPFAVYGTTLPGDSGSLMKNGLEYQKELNSRESIRWAVGRYGAFPTEWGTGRLAESDYATEGGKGSDQASGHGPRRLWLDSDVSGNPPSLNVLEKGIPLSEMRMDSQELINEAFQMMRLPAGLVSGVDSPAEQPTTLKLRLYPTMVRYNGLTTEADQFWQSLLGLVRSSIVSQPETEQYEVSAAGALKAEDVKFSVKYTENPFPHADGLEREQDRRDVAEGLMPAAEYILKYRKPRTLEELRRAVEAYNSNSTLGGGLFGSGFGAPPNGGGL